MKKLEEPTVSFETAKLAREKGFEDAIGIGYGKSYYTYDGKLNGSVVDEISEYYRLKKKEGLDHYQAEEKNTKKTIPAPTQSLLQKWLREKHNIIVIPNYIYISCGADQYGPLCDKLIYDVDEICMKVDGYFITIPLTSTLFDTYEEALEEGLRKALNLIPGKN